MCHVGVIMEQILLQLSAMDLFFSDVVNSELRFSRDAAGVIAGLILVQEGQEQVASKKV
jgi:hypothetical protein